MENLVYYKYKDMRGKSRPTKMSGMMNEQMWLEISSSELQKKKKFFYIGYTPVFPIISGEKSHESDF